MAKSLPLFFAHHMWCRWSLYGSSSCLFCGFRGFWPPHMLACKQPERTCLNVLWHVFSVGMLEGGNQTEWKKGKKTNSFGSISSNYIDNTSICNQTDWHVGQNHPCVGALCRLGQGWVIFQLWSCIALRLHLCAIALAGTWRWKSARIPLRATLRSWLHEFAQVAEAFRYWTWYWVVSIKIILLNTIC